MMSENADIYVQVLYDFNYVTDEGCEISMREGEELLVLKKANEDWWQVIRDSEKHPFYAPSSYLDIIGHQKNAIIDQVDNVKDINENVKKTEINKNNCDKPVTKMKHTVPSSASEINMIIGDGQNKNSLVKTKHLVCPLSFSNPLCADEDIRLNFNQRNSSIQRKKEKEESYGDNDMHSLSSISGNVLQLSGKMEDESSVSEDATSPIYVNIPLSSSSSPPTPRPDEKPQRQLPNNWLEYVDENGRKYYYNAVSGKVTWKPPRRKENHQSTPLSSNQSSPKLDESALSIPQPPPKQLKPKLKKLAHSSTESLDSPTSPCMFTILPPGWTQECDLKTGLVYYYNEATKKKWLSSTDENGRPYFYDEYGEESVWELPDISVLSDTEESKVDLKSKSATEDASSQISSDKSGHSSSFVSPKLRNKKAPKLPEPRNFRARSMVVPETVHIPYIEDGKNSLPRSFADGYWPSVQDGHFTITRKGTLNKTKLIEGGRRVRKNWTTSFVVLTDVFLLFYKDIRSAHLSSPTVKPEICVDLNGANIEWCPEKSSRRNVFQVSAVLGHQLLLQDDNAQTTKEWFDTIQAAIAKLPSSLENSGTKDFLSEKDEISKKDIKLSRSRSTRPFHSNRGSNEDVTASIPPEKRRKIRDKLRQFFVRRPTMESLREKGIIMDEPVFGCHLDNLCTREKTTIPKFVKKCIETIEKKELTADGLYRASGNLSQVQKIRFHVNQDDYSCLEEEEDVHVLTGALKMFFREMKEPLFPFRTFDSFMNAIALPDRQGKLKALKDLIFQLSEPNFDTIKFLLQHLLRVTEYHKQNRMQVQNLAIVFGPTLMWSEEESANIALDMMHQNRIVEFLLLEFSTIFSR